MRHRFQFSLSRLLGSMCFVGIAIACAKAIPELGHEAKPFAFFAETAAIGAAIGALRGRAVGGAGAGLVIAFVLMLMSSR